MVEKPTPRYSRNIVESGFKLHEPNLEKLANHKKHYRK